jgi:hypothetical protein
MSSGQTGLSRPSRPEHKLDRAVVLDEMTRSGFRLVGEPDLLPYQYVLIFAASRAAAWGPAGKPDARLRRR